EGVPLAIFGATNHQNQLDSAIWRRFTFHFSFEFPDYHLRKKIIESFLNKVKNAKIGVDESIYTDLNDEYDIIQGISNNLERRLGYVISEFEGNILWDEVHKKNKIKGLLELSKGYSGSDIERGTKVSLLKAISTERLTYDLFYKSLKLVGGTAIHVERQDILSNTAQKLKNSKRTENNQTKQSSPPEI
ncbi:MAG: hypothetical protein ACFFFY_07450, partial [Promethearchaeota archaeon]